MVDLALTTLLWVAISVPAQNGLIPPDTSIIRTTQSAKNLKRIIEELLNGLNCEENYTGFIERRREIPLSSTCPKPDLQKYTSSPNVLIWMNGFCLQIWKNTKLSFPLDIFLATSGAINSRVPTMEHFTLSIPPNSRASPKSINL